MTKKKMWDNSNMQEDIKWGNIELPGLSDQELYSKNWNLIDSARLRAKDPQWRARLKIIANEPSRLEKIRKANVNRLSYPVSLIDNNNNRYDFESLVDASEFFNHGAFQSGGKKYFPEDGSINFCQKKTFKDWAMFRPILKIDYFLEVQKQRQELITKRLKQKKLLQKNANERKRLKTIEFWKTIEGQEKKKENSKRTQQMGKNNAKPIITPDGEFPSQTAAAKFYSITKGSMATRMKYHPDKYYYKK